MKHLSLLAVLLVMTCTFAFAQSPHAEGKHFGKKMIVAAVEDNQEGLNKLSQDLNENIQMYINTEEDVANYLDGFAAGIREACDEYGLDKDVSSNIVEMFYKNIIVGMWHEVRQSALSK